MKSFFCLAVIVLLSSCASTPSASDDATGVSDSFAPISGLDPRLQHPQFYMNDSDSLPAWTHVAPQSNR